jgi:hypothetical protein
MRAEAARDAVRVAVDYAHVPVVHAERVGADLRKHRLHALAERGGAGDHFDASVLIHPRPCRIERPQSAFLNKKGQSCPDGFAAQATGR